MYKNIFFISTILFLFCITSSLAKAEKPKNNAFQQISSCADSRGNRYFSIYTNSKNWSEIKNYAKTKPFISGKMTAVFFFDNMNTTPKFKGPCGEFDKQYNKYWVAGYWKYPNGSENYLTDYPMK